MYNRVNSYDYERDSNGKLTIKGNKDLKQDVKILKSHYGYNIKTHDNSNRFSEFNCDIPIIEMSSDNVIREIADDKGKKYTDGKTDLFIFVTDDEMDSVDMLIESRHYNSASTGFFNAVKKSPFNNILLCVWDWEQLNCIIENPDLIHMKVEANEVKIDRI